MRQIDEIRGADAAVEHALRGAKPGDLILIQADTVDETVSFIRRYMESIAPEPLLEEPIDSPAAPPADAAAEPAPMVQAVSTAAKV